MPLASSTGLAGWQQGLRYGALGLPLAFVALPLYVVLPNHYATQYAIPLATLGALLLGARLLDAVADPWIGRLADRWFAHSARRVLLIMLAAAVVLALGFRALFFPPWAAASTAVMGNAGAHNIDALLVWCGAFLAITYLSYSVLTVLHQAWGARLGGDEAQRTRVVSWREGLALVGVLVASVLPSVAGLSVTSAVFAGCLCVGMILLWRAPSPRIDTPAVSNGQIDTPAVSNGQIGTGGLVDSAAAEKAFAGPLSTPGFRRLLAVYLVNGVASAVPATLVLFFIRDRLQAQSFEPLFLASYFAAGALSMPLWLRAVARFGLARAWLGGMVMAMASFVWAAALGTGDVWAFAAVCVASGVALGADLSLPSALLAGVIQRAGHAQRLEGAYFGWWNFATKLNLALAAGIALPMLALFGYAPGARDAGALQALTLAYCVLPCVLKLLAAGLLWILVLRKEQSP
jgi:glycoside/pentoside/hexuronide:cation symporter, GPH family